MKLMVHATVPTIIQLKRMSVGINVTISSVTVISSVAKIVAKIKSAYIIAYLATVYLSMQNALMIATNNPHLATIK